MAEKYLRGFGFSVIGPGTSPPNTMLGCRQGANDFAFTGNNPAGADWNPLPADLTISRVGIKGDANAPNNVTYQPTTGIPVSPTGPSVVVTSGTSQGIGNVSVTQPAPLLAANLATTAFSFTGNISAGSFTGRTMWKYNVANPFGNYNVLGSGFSAANFFLANNTHFMALNSTVSSLTETSVQSAMPVAGQFKYMLAVIQVDNTTGDSLYTITLQVNGNPTIQVQFSNDASPQMGRNIVDSANVNAHDLVNFKFNSTTTGHIAKGYASIGFTGALLQ